MPNALDSIVRVTIRSYADLNVARLLLNYPGLMKLIRRADDEIISIMLVKFISLLFFFFFMLFKDLF